MCIAIGERAPVDAPGPAAGRNTAKGGMAYDHDSARTIGSVISDGKIEKAGVRESAGSKKRRPNPTKNQGGRADHVEPGAEQAA
jgi:hypothetical protein